MTLCTRLVPGLLALSAIAACSSDSATGIQGTCDVTNPVTSLAVTPASATVYFRSLPRASDSLQLTPAALGRFDNPRSDVQFRYRSTDTSVAVVSASGVVLPRATGHTTVTVSTCDQETLADITVVSDVASVIVAPTSATLVAGDSLILGATAAGLDGTALSGITFGWSGDPSEMAAIADAGQSSVMLHTLGAGTITVDALAEGTRGEASLIVLPRVFLAGAAGTAPGMSAGPDYTCATISMGRGYCWGVDDNGQLGAAADSSCFEEVDDGGKLKPCSLLPLRFAPDLAFTTLSAGSAGACGIAANGRAYCWGPNSQGQLGNGMTGGPAPSLVTSALTFKQVDVGGSHACGIASDDDAYCWGQDVFGQLGDERKVNSTTPIPVVVDPVAGTPVKFASLTAGLSHTCGIASTGVAYCWGSNAHGQLGVTSTGESCGSTPCSSKPVKVAVPTNVSFVALSAGDDHTCGLTSSGGAYCWGADSTGQLGDGSPGSDRSAPLAVVDGHSFSQISSGTGFTCALEQGTGAAWCWGDDSDLELGIGPYSGGDSVRAMPVAVGGGHIFSVVTAGMRHVCGVTQDGHAYCWGSDLYGALGNTLQAAFRGFPQEVATPQ